MSLELYPRGVDFVSSTRLDHGNFVTGDIRWAVDPSDGRTKKFIFCKAAGTIADGLGCKKDTTTGTEVTVVVTAAATDIGVGVNNTGASISSGQYFWALREGVGYGDPEAGGWADGDQITLAANGEFDTLASNGLGKVVGVAIADSSATVNANLILFSFPGTGCAAS